MKRGADVLVLISAALCIRGPFCACGRWQLQEESLLYDFQRTNHWLSSDDGSLERRCEF
jgi:hypothetical protein